MEQKLKDAASCLPETQLEAAAICGLARLEQGNGKPGFYGYGFKRMLVATACLLLVLALGFGGYAYAAEVKEYNAAVAFFAENNLSTEGLTREEIKAIYRDITTKNHTDETLENATQAPNKIPGYEIPQDTVSKEELEEIKNNRVPGNSVYYRIKPGNSTYYIEKYTGETLAWTVEWDEHGVPGYAVVSDGILVFDCNFAGNRTLLYKYDLDGNLLWTDYQDNGFEWEYITCVVENADGSYAVIGSAHENGKMHLCLSQYTAYGERLLYKSNPAEGPSRFAVKLGNGYLVKLAGDQLIHMDQQGNIEKALSYESDDCTYHIQSMIEYNGKVYLSAYAMQKWKPDELDEQGRTPIEQYIRQMHEQGTWEFETEGFASILRQRYTALLLVCDPVSGVPQEYYSVSGSRGGSLLIGEDGLLIWNVENIVSAGYSGIWGEYAVCCCFQYIFGDDSLQRQEQTDRTSMFFLNRNM